MTQYYYSVQPFLAWCLNHYFYNKQHFTYIGASFYPYRLGNPRSSSPLRLYEDFYEPWKDDDFYSAFIDGKRDGLCLGVEKANQNLQPKLTPYVFGSLQDICKNIDIAFYYPVVYRVDIDPIKRNDPNRLEPKNSGLKPIGLCQTASNEYTLAGLREITDDDSSGDFDLLFLDFEVEIELQDKHIASMRNGNSQKDDPPCEVRKLEIYKLMKQLRDECDTLSSDQVLNMLKPYLGKCNVP